MTGRRWERRNRQTLNLGIIFRGTEFQAALRAADEHLAHVLTGMGVYAPSTAMITLPDRYLQLTGSSFEFPCSDLPKNVRFVGPMAPPSGGAFEEPSLWSEVDGRKPVGSYRGQALHRSSGCGSRARRCMTLSEGKLAFSKAGSNRWFFVSLLSFHVAGFRGKISTKVLYSKPKPERSNQPVVWRPLPAIVTVQNKLDEVPADARVAWPDLSEYRLI